MNPIKYIRDGRSPIPEKESTSWIMSRIRNKDTKPELLLRKTLRQNGLIGYRVHWKAVPGRPDIAFPGKKVAIFVHGCFWHRCPLCSPPTPKTNTEFWNKKFIRNVNRDKIKIEQLDVMNWKSIVIWECQIKNDSQSCVDKITPFIIK